MFDLSFDNPSEWPSEFIGLKRIDNLLRCPICFEFFNITMMIPSCSHNYCSLCIRKYITYKEGCPTCNSPATGCELKCNRIMDELVKTFSTIRKQLLCILKLYRNYEFSMDTDVKHGAKTKGTAQTGKVSSDDESQFEELPVFRDPNSKVNNSKVECAKSFREADNGKRGVTASCPVCCENIALQQMNIHLDVCLEKGGNGRRRSPSDCPSTSFHITESTKKQQHKHKEVGKSPMKHIVLTSSLNVLQDKELKSKVTQYGLPLRGDRKDLIKRIEQYILLYNSQCDALEPMSASTIVKEVCRNEQNLMHGYTPGIVVDTHDHSLSTQEKVDFCIKYGQKHEKHYHQLISEIKGRRENKIGSTSNQSKCAESDNTGDTKGSTGNQSKCAGSDNTGDTKGSTGNQSKCSASDNIGDNKGSTSNQSKCVVSGNTGDNKGSTSNQSKCAENDNIGDNDNNELIEIFDSDPSEREGDDISSFGYVPHWFDTDLLKDNVNKTGGNPMTSCNADENVVLDKGVKRKAKKTKSTSKKKIVQSGNIASYFVGASKKEVKSKENNDGKKLTNEERSCVFLVDDSDESTDDDILLSAPPCKSLPPSAESLMQNSQSVLQPAERDGDRNGDRDRDGDRDRGRDKFGDDDRDSDRDGKGDGDGDGDSDRDIEITECVQELPMELEGDVATRVFSSTVVAEPDSESLFISEDLSPVLFKESSSKCKLPYRRRHARTSPPPDRVVKKGVNSLDSQLSLEISNLVDDAVENPHTFSSDSESDYSLQTSTLVPVRKIHHDTITMRDTITLQEDNAETQNVIPAPPTDFCFSQADF